jgi:hypothetical protein
MKIVFKPKHLGDGETEMKIETILFCCHFVQN